MLRAAMPLDPVHDGRHRLSSAPDARESLVFVVSLPEEGIGAAAYTWVGGDGRAGAFLAVFGPGAGADPIVELVDGIAVDDEMGFEDWHVGALTVHHREPLRVADVAFAGERLTMDCRFEALSPAHNYGSHPDGCPWYLADDRYEQSLRCSGVLGVDGRQLEMATTAHRDHSWGTRDWGAPLHWKWILAQVAPDVGVHVMELEALGRHELRGYVCKGGDTARVTALEQPRLELDDDLVQRRWSARVRDEAGRTTDVALDAHAHWEFKVSPALTLHEVGMRARVDGAEGAGHIEMAWPPDYLARNRA